MLVIKKIPKLTDHGDKQIQRTKNQLIFGINLVMRTHQLIENIKMIHSKPLFKCVEWFYAQSLNLSRIPCTFKSLDINLRKCFSDKLKI
ncbi:hypothetical protein T4B_10258 [Trichinella pseudospiralis]|uniref:Uncharacterized protein n=1 Tax=Trichinella pseudospiralis TaxID=6337 RepID=A0A0V1K7S2_TRIPS|nr:hypothetical protein T4B_10258 [Trichinella pseudospiralis]KRZ43271.1 hypothetical protein T4C_11146 [Trichinella pseudospiralis]